MATHAPITGGATAHAYAASPAHTDTPFDPAAWLSRFEAVGGGWIVRDCLSLAILVEGRTDEELGEARQMVVELTAADRATLVAHLRGRELGEG